MTLYWINLGNLTRERPQHKDDEKIAYLQLYFSGKCVKEESVCEADKNECKMDEISPQWYKIVGIAFFYVAILLVGIYATKQGQKKRRASMDLAEDSIVAGRNIGTVQFFLLVFFTD